MRKVHLLLGLAAILAAGITLILFLGRSKDGERTGDRIAAAVRPPDEPGVPADAELTSTGRLDPEGSEDGDREAAKVRKKITPGAERVIPVAAEGEADELYGIVLGIYGVPVAGAEVKVESIGDTADGLLQVLGGSTDKTAVTKTDGTFRVPRPGRWEEVRVTITARGFLDFSRSQDLVDHDGDQNLGVFELDAGVVLAGKVYDADGNPVAGAEVRRTDSEDQSFRFRGGFGGGNDGVKTGEDGGFEMPHEETGDYVLVVTHDDHPTGRFPGVAPQPGAEDTGIVLRLPRGATIAGVIKEFPTGRDHIRVAAQVVDPNAETGAAGFASMLEESGFSPDGLESDVDAGGAFSIKGLEAGKSYRVRAFARGGFFGRTAVSEERSVRAGDQKVELTWDAGGRLTARVVDEATAGAVKDVDVRFRWDTEGDDFDFNNQTRRRSFRTGEVEIEELRPRAGQKTLSLLLSAPGYLDLRHEGVAMTAESDVEIGTLRMKRAPLVRLQVVDAEGEGVSRARVRLAPEDDEKKSGGNGPAGWFSLDKQAATGKTDSDGIVELPAPATATARLEVAHPRFAGYLRAGVPMPTDGTREETARLSEGGTIEVLVVDSRGNPVPDLRIRHRYPDGALEDDTASHEVNKRGELRLRNELPGIHAFRTYEEAPAAEGEEPEWTEVVVADGRTANVVLEVAARATLEGKITEAGAPLDRATVTLLAVEESISDEMVIEMTVRSGQSYRGGGASSSDRTDRLGRYSLEDVPAGRYRLSVSHSERAAPHYVPVTIRAGSNRLDVDVPLNAVEGRVVDSGGAAIEGATLRLVPVKEAKKEDADVERQAFEEFFGGNRDAAKSGPDGSYRLRGVPTDHPFLVQASRDGYVPSQSEPVTVSVGQRKGGVDVTLQPGATLRVRVVGETSAFFFLRARWDGKSEDAPSQKVAMVRRGEAVFKGLKPGPWRISKSDGDDAGQVVEVKVGGETAIDFAL